MEERKGRHETHDHVYRRGFLVIYGPDMTTTVSVAKILQIQQITLSREWHTDFQTDICYADKLRQFSRWQKQWFVCPQESRQESNDVRRGLMMNSYQVLGRFSWFASICVQQQEQKELHSLIFHDEDASDDEDDDDEDDAVERQDDEDCNDDRESRSIDYNWCPRRRMSWKQHQEFQRESD